MKIHYFYYTRLNWPTKPCIMQKGVFYIIFIRGHTLRVGHHTFCNMHYFPTLTADTLKTSATLATVASSTKSKEQVSSKLGKSDQSSEKLSVKR